MAKALRLPADCEILNLHSKLEFRNGSYSYRIAREAGRSSYAVSDGVNAISIPILYCFGYGKTGQTYVLEYKGTYYESRVSFFPAIQRLDFTLGAPRSDPKSLEDAIGQVMLPKEAARCFNCHATAAVGSRGLQLDHMMPGVNCEACHGPGERHVAAMMAGGSKEKR
ncbi:MAG TPA: multiheme c-type cytochrome, partial [Blastocatellia bacterium]|nr:multiheme c-type cytochrome [Blastocatellia bacterium]